MNHLQSDTIGNFRLTEWHKMLVRGHMVIQPSLEWCVKGQFNSSIINCFSIWTMKKYFFVKIKTFTNSVIRILAGLNSIGTKLVKKLEKEVERKTKMAFTKCYCIWEFGNREDLFIDCNLRKNISILCISFSCINDNNFLF